MNRLRSYLVLRLALAFRSDKNHTQIQMDGAAEQMTRHMTTSQT